MIKLKIAPFDKFGEHLRSSFDKFNDYVLHPWEFLVAEPAVAELVEASKPPF